MRIFITGGTGFIGSHLLKNLLNNNYEIIALRRPKKNILNKIKNHKLTWLEKEISEICIEDLYDVKLIIHLAATGVSPRIATWEELYEINIGGTLKMCRFAKELNARIIISGTFAEYGQSGLNYDFIPVTAPLIPTFPYAASKASSSILSLSYADYEKIEIAYLRLFNVFGEGQHEKNLWPSLKKAALSGSDFNLTPGEQIRDFISVEDVCKFFLKVINLDHDAFSSPLIINVGSGKPISIKAFCKYWWETYNAKGKLIFGAFPYRQNEVMRYVPEITDL